MFIIYIIIYQVETIDIVYWIEYTDNFMKKKKLAVFII